MIGQAHTEERAARTLSPNGDRTLLAVSQMLDPLGVLSVYVDAAPQRGSGARPGWHIAAENALRDLRARFDRETPADRARSLRARFLHFEGMVSDFLYSRGRGRGRALFLPLGGGQPVAVGFQMPLPDLVVLEERAHIGPLLAAYDAGRPVGIAVASGAKVRVLELRLGLAQDLETREFEDADADWGELRGVEERRVRFLESAGDRLVELAAERHWERVALCGDPRLTDVVRQRFPVERRRQLAAIPQALEWLPPSRLAEVVAPELEGLRAAEQVAHVRRVLDEGLGGGAAALGLSQTLQVLNDARAAHLLIDMRERQGWAFADGRLAVHGEMLPGADPDGAANERYLTERMVERAIETGADVTPLAGEAAEMLGSHGGVAAVLRW
jgi:hypothetical protein